MRTVDLDFLKVVGAGASNVAVAIFAALADWQEVFSFLLTLTQIGVATVTFLYIIKKLRKK